MSHPLARTPLTAWHAEHHAKLVDFADWEMPIHYSSIVTEHLATRTRVGLFDVSHMGRFRFGGSQAMQAIDHLVTRRVDTLRPGRIRYSLVTNDAGGTLDDVLVYHLIDVSGVPFYFMVVNAGNRQKIWDWLVQHTGNFDVTMHDQTLETAMIAVQGPFGIQIAQPLFTALTLDKMPYFTGAMTRCAGCDVLVSRTGYTGEDGVELIVPVEHADAIWRQLYAQASQVGGAAVGLGARDTLRLEAAMPLYGHELTEAISPIQAGLQFAVDLEGRNFIGREALAAFSVDAALPCRIGLRMEGKRVPRQDYAIHANGRAIGQITSGTYSPTLQCPVAMGYVRKEFAALGTVLQVDLRGREIDAMVVQLPFYRRAT